MMKRAIAFFTIVLLAVAWGFSTIQPAKAGSIDPWRGIITVCNNNTPAACTHYQTQQTFETRGLCFVATQEQADRLIQRTQLERPNYQFRVGIRCVAENAA